MNLALILERKLAIVTKPLYMSKGKKEEVILYYVMLELGYTVQTNANKWYYVRLSFQNFAFMSSSLLFQSTLFARVTYSFSFGTYSTEKNGTYSISLIKHVLLHCHVSSTYHFL